MTSNFGCFASSLNAPLRSFSLFLCWKKFIHLEKNTANKSNQHFISVKLLHFISFVIPTFPQDLRGQQLEIKPPHYKVFHLLHYLALVKSEAIPSKILNVIGQTSLDHPTDFLPFALASKSCLGIFLRHSAYMAKPSKLRSFNAEK